MTFNLKNIFDTQRKLDETIYRNSGVTYGKVKEEVRLAFVVELGELANEIRCFKYWSKKMPSDRAIILEEYVDGIHFLSTMAYHFKINPLFNIKNVEKIENKKVLTKKINSIFFQFKFMKHKWLLKSIYRKYLELGMLLGFSFEDIEKAYAEKNVINYQRQENNY